MKNAIKIGAAAATMLALWLAAATAQSVTPGLPVTPMGYCQLSASQLASAVGLSSCVRASFTGTGSGTTLTAASVTGFIQAGDSVAGTGVPAGTKIVAQLTGTAGGAGTYQTSAATTSSGASLTSGGIPTDAQGRIPNLVVLFAETAAVRWRDDGAAPTAAIGMEIPAAATYSYAGTMTKLQFIAASGSPLLNAAFYRTSSP